MKHPSSGARAASAREQVPTAKFWFYADGWVRIRLRARQTLEWRVRTQTDEGWFEQSVRWTHAVDRVTRVSETDGRDCDGRTSTRSVSECPIDRLAADVNPVRFGWPATPDWRPVDSSQRDYSAEAAGY